MKKLKTFSLKKIFLALIVLVIIGVVYFNQSNNSKSTNNNQQILDRLGQLILLPEQDPSMYLITDPTQLQKNQPDFFVNAKSGQWLIIYPSLAIIYDLQQNKIIKAGGIEIHSNS